MTTLYVLLRVGWGDASEWSYGEQFYPRGGWPVEAFTDPERVQARLVELEGQRRQGVNPFLYGATVENWSSLPEGVFRDWLLDAGLPDPPVGYWEEQSGGGDPFDPEGGEDISIDLNLPYEEDLEEPRLWVAWWERHRPGMTPEQVALVWEACDKVRFYRVKEMEAPKPLVSAEEVPP